MDIPTLLPAVPHGAVSLLLGLGAATFALVTLTQIRPAAAMVPPRTGEASFPAGAAPATHAGLCAQLRHPIVEGSGLDLAPEAVARAITAIAGIGGAGNAVRARSARHAWWETLAVGMMRDARLAGDAPAPEALAFLKVAHPALFEALHALGLPSADRRVPMHVAPGGAGILNHWMAEDETRRRIEKPFVETALDAARHRPASA